MEYMGCIFFYRIYSIKTKENQFSLVSPVSHWATIILSIDVFVYLFICIYKVEVYLPYTNNNIIHSSDVFVYLFICIYKVEVYLPYTNNT